MSDNVNAILFFTFVYIYYELYMYDEIKNTIPYITLKSYVYLICEKCICCFLIS